MKLAINKDKDRMAKRELHSNRHQGMEVLGTTIAAHLVFSVIIKANIALISIPPATKISVNKCYYDITGTDMKSFCAHWEP